jgi:hypothetical protein
MIRGEFLFNGDSIKLDKEGRLLDGQHRLAAVVATDIPLTTVVVRGLPVVAQETMDVGARRNVGDMLALRGVPSASDTASCVSFVFRYETGVLPARQPTPTPQQVISRYEIDPKGFAAAVALGKGVARGTQSSRSVMAALAYITNLIDCEEAEAFLYAVRTGINLDAENPALVFRNLLLRERMYDSGRRLPSESVFALGIKAWNAYRLNRPTRMLHYRLYGPKSELFPVAE